MNAAGRTTVTWLAALFLVGWVLAIVATAGVAPVLVVLGVLALFALPGWLWMWRLTSYSRGFVLLVGGLCGIVVSAIVQAALVFALGWNVLAVVATVLLLAASAFLLPGRRIERPVSSAAPDTRDLAFLLIVGTVLLAVLVVPLARNPTIGPDDHAYHSLFAHDYLMRGTFSVSVMRGFPPKDAFLTSERMNNYCLYYSLVALAMHVGGPQVAPERFIAATDLILPFLFLAVLFFVCRAFLRGRWAWFAVLLGLFAYSFNDLFVFTKYVHWSGIDRLHEFAAGYSDLSHGWYRDFLVEPHAVLALIFGFTAFALSSGPRPENGPARPYPVIGILLAGSFASDGFLGTLFVVAFGVTFSARWLARRKDPSVPGPRRALEAALPFALLLGASLATGLSSLGTRTGSLGFTPYMTVWKYGVVLFPLLLGPAILLAFWAIFARGRGWGAIWTMAGVCLLAALLVQHSDPTFADLVLRKSVKVLRLPVILLGTIAFAGMRRGRGIAIALLAISVPTLATDLVTLSGFHDAVPTSRVTRAEVEAHTWIRENTAREAVVQSLPQSEDKPYRLSAPAMFGGRAMALGHKKMAQLSSPSDEALERTVSDIEALFTSGDLERIARTLDAYAIDYVYVGPAERALDGARSEVFEENPERFERVYARDGVSIYRVAP